MLKLKLFGPGQVLYFDRSLTDFPRQQCYLLLCYLLLNRQSSQPRERLAAIFWDEYPLQAARKQLRHNLWRLRQALQTLGAPADDYLLSREEYLTFGRSVQFELDIDRFETVIARYRHIPGEALTPEQSTHLEEAVALYTGDLLEGLYVDWCLHERERLRMLYLDTLDKLMFFYQINGNYERGLAYGERILNYDNVRETVHQHMMRLYWLAGQRSEALAQYKRCAQILRDELGISPMAETTRLYKQIATGQVISTPSSNKLAAQRRAEQALQRLTEQARQKLQRLRTDLETAQRELQELEDILQQLYTKAVIVSDLYLDKDSLSNSPD